ncbi:MAG TPA: alkaline phosphatase family protein [Rugosimonospora sp.]|nr:alkaline phosphatase family protein [Rugosimonospora sp.]
MRALAACLAALAVLAPAAPATAAGQTATPIKHFVYLMQGDRTFDNYFGTYPGADGIPAGTCQPLVRSSTRSGCVKPFPLHGTAPQPLEPGRSTLAAQLDNGRLDGFVAAYAAQGRDGTAAMGYYDARDLPYYWAVAQRYVLFDRFFASVPYGYRTNRSYWVAAAPQPGGSDRVPPGGYGDQPTIFDRLQAAGVSWKFYIQDYQPGQTFRAASPANPAAQTVRVPLLNYARFLDDPALRSHLVDLDEYYRDLAAGTLPAVAYVATSGASERSARSLPTAQNLVRGMLTQLMLSRYWRSSAFLWSYDGSGGWYDHVPPPPGLGLRVPALLVSPYARAGQVNDTVLESVAALRFIEHNWGLPPLSTRDAHAGDLATAFDFAAGPRPAQLIPVQAAAPHPPLVRVPVIVWCYGGAVLLLLALLALAAAPRRPRKSTVEVTAS